MKKNILLLTFLSLTLSKFYGQDTIYIYSGFISTFAIFDLNDRDTAKKYFYSDTTLANNIWQIGTPSKTVFDGAYSIPLALVTDTLNTYPSNNIASFTFIVLTDCNEFEIDFWHRINSDSLADGGVIEYSIDGGINWNNIINSGCTFYNFYSNSSTISSNSNKPGFTGTSGWVHSGFYGTTLNNYVKYRFTFTSDGTNTNKDGWMIDDVFINGIMAGVNEIIPNSQFHVFPNPTSTFITIQSNNLADIISVTIKDVLGRLVLIPDQTKIDMSEFPLGMYFLEMRTSKGTYYTRVIKQ